MSSCSGTFSVSRRSGSGSGLPSLSRQIAAVSSRSDSAVRMALRSGGDSLSLADVAALSRMRSNSERSLKSVFGSVESSVRMRSCCL